MILIVIVFIFILSLGILLLEYFLSPSENPFVVRGMLDGNDGLTVSQNPADSDAVTIKRSNNEDDGMEFTWSIWIYVNELQSDDQYQMFQHIFNKGTDDTHELTGLVQTNNAPGIYLKDGTNKLFIKMDSVKANDPITSIEIDNIPIKKWVHVILRLQNNILDVYINGTVSKRLVLQHTPKQNFQDVNVNHNNGFSGHLSDLRYFDRALNVFEINGILNSGPNLTSSSLSAFNDTGFYGYLSNMWYSSHV